jgi:hypothetical protein
VCYRVRDDNKLATARTQVVYITLNRTANHSPNETHTTEVHGSVS